MMMHCELSEPVSKPGSWKSVAGTSLEGEWGSVLYRKTVTTPWKLNTQFQGNPCKFQNRELAIFSLFNPVNTAVFSNHLSDWPIS